MAILSFLLQQTRNAQEACSGTHAAVTIGITALWTAAVSFAIIFIINEQSSIYISTLNAKASFTPEHQN